MQITINKTASIVEVDYDNLPDNSKAFILNYGIRQILNDCHSSIIRKDFETNEAFAKAVSDAVSAKITALAAGDLTIRRGGSSQPADPVEREALAIARAEIKSAAKAKGLSLKVLGEEKFAELVKANLAKNGERITKQAKANLKKAAEAPTVNLDDLLA